MNASNDEKRKKMRDGIGYFRFVDGIYNRLYLFISENPENAVDDNFKNKINNQKDSNQ